MSDGIGSNLRSLAGKAYRGTRQLAGATKSAVSPELTRSASACQLIEALEDRLGDDISDMIKAGQQDRAKSVVDASKRLSDLQKSLSCPTK